MHSPKKIVQHMIKQIVYNYSTIKTIGKKEGKYDMNNKLPLDYAKHACDTMMRIPAEELPPVGGFHYHQGVFLMGMSKVYNICKEKKYYDYIKCWVDSVTDTNGMPIKYHKEHFDDLMPGMLLYGLYDEEGDEKYKKTLENLVSEVKGWKKNKKGGFWHKQDITPNQVWLDGLFMYGPLVVNYAYRFNSPEYFDIVNEQLNIMWDNMRDAETGLLKHAWDDSLEEEWADDDTGLSAEFWGRAIGWYGVALAEIYEYMPKKYQDNIADKLKALISALAKFQKAENGLWYQVVNKNEKEDNWPELSCSCLFIYTIAKALKFGIVDDTYEKNIEQGYLGVISKLKVDETGGLLVGDVCIGTGVGDYQFYIERPVRDNDLHGVGAFLYMVSQVEELRRIKM